MDWLLECFKVIIDKKNFLRNGLNWNLCKDSWKNKIWLKDLGPSQLLRILSELDSSLCVIGYKALSCLSNLEQNPLNCEPNR